MVYWRQSGRFLLSARRICNGSKEIRCRMYSAEAVTETPNFLANVASLFPSQNSDVRILKEESASLNSGRKEFSVLPPSQDGDFRKYCHEEVSIGPVTFKFETGKLARLASGSVVATVGDTSVLATAVSSVHADSSRDFLPLQVDYREKEYAAGRIPNTFMRREGAPKEREILCSRIIDRSVRPLFPNGFFAETQIVTSVLCSDGENDPDIIAVNAASAALSISSIPWNGPLGCVRIGRIDGKLVVNPTMSQLSDSDLNIVYACTAENTLMIETQAMEISNSELEEALKLAHSEAVKLIEPQLRLSEKVGQSKRAIHSLHPSEGSLQRVKDMAYKPVSAVLSNPLYGKQDRGQALSHLERDISDYLREVDDRETLGVLSLAMAEVKKDVVKVAAFEGRPRADGRGLNDVRPISCQAGIYSNLHGSSLFTRGNTQVICTVTLGSVEESQRLNSLTGTSQKQFMVHYSFPGFSINEVKMEKGGLNRREVGHGTLAEKALIAVLPEEEDIPFSVRLTSEVLGSDGSSSMATVCGGSLALMDAGIPLKEHVAGISMGLFSVKNPGTKEILDYRLLTDILGLEDYLGDMDFKIAGTREAITAIQLDMKLPGIPLKILCEALYPAQVARAKVIDVMESEVKVARGEPRWNSPKSGTVPIPKESVGRLIGPSGSTIKSIQKKSGAKLSVSDGGVVSIFAPNQAIYDVAVDLIETTLGRDIEVGATYDGTVLSVKEFGAFLEIDGGIVGLLHISEIQHEKVQNIDDHLKTGQSMRVVCVGRDLRGNVKLSRKPLLPPPVRREFPAGKPEHSPLMSAASTSWFAKGAGSKPNGSIIGKTSSREKSPAGVTELSGASKAFIQGNATSGGPESRGFTPNTRPARLPLPRRQDVPLRSDETDKE